MKFICTTSCYFQQNFNIHLSASPFKVSRQAKQTRIEKYQSHQSHAGVSCHFFGNEPQVYKPMACGLWLVDFDPCLFVVSEEEVERYSRYA